MRKARPKRGRARLADTAASAWRRDRARATPKNFCTARATSRLSLPPFTREAGKPGATIARVEPGPAHCGISRGYRSEEHTSELQSLMRISYAVFCLKKKNPPVPNPL